MTQKAETKAERIKRLHKTVARRAQDLPDVASALEFRRECYELNAKEFAEILGLRPSHYSEIINGKRDIPKGAIKRAFAIGVPATVLLQP